MARISRNPSKAYVPTDAPKRLTKYKTAIYARLSIEDNGTLGDSLQTQIEMLEKYVEKRPELEFVKTYFDNGATGTNFDRAGFNDMMNDIKSETINCIVVKDLSRFGRNYIEAGEYLENIFPYLGVRFISVNDHYDSIEANNNEMLMVALKSVLHDVYAKDISRKICTLFDVKKKSGEYLGKYAPYGYSKSNTDKHKLVINEETAPVIRDIFKWRLEGLGVTAIARKLNDLGIPSQYRYLFEKELLQGKAGEEHSLWRGSSVQGVLENVNYIGCVVERKSEKAHYKGGKEKVIPKSEWQIIRGTHEAIIDEDTFENVQKLMEESRKVRRSVERNVKRPENILKGLIICGCCGNRMERDGGYYKDDMVFHRFGCPRKYIKNKQCDSKSAKEEVLREVIWKSLQSQIEAFNNAKLMVNKYVQSKSCKDKCRQLQSERAACEKKIKNNRGIRKALYQDFREEILSQSEYQYAKETYEKSNEALEAKIAEIEVALQSLTTPFKESENFAKVSLFTGDDDLTADMCKAFIEKVEVNGESIKIFYTFTEELEKMSNYLSNLSEGGNKPCVHKIV